MTLSVRGGQEPELLRVDAERVRRQMQEVAVENYAAFIAASEALSFVRAQLEGFDSHLEALVMLPGPSLAHTTLCLITSTVCPLCVRKLLLYDDQ